MSPVNTRSDGPVSVTSVKRSPVRWNPTLSVSPPAPSPIQVDVAGGDTLKVGFQRTGDRFTDVTLTGPADLVFTGDIQI